VQKTGGRGCKSEDGFLIFSHSEKAFGGPAGVFGCCDARLLANKVPWG
jgi:hypothetical protein